MGAFTGFATTRKGSPPSTRRCPRRLRTRRCCNSSPSGGEATWAVPLRRRGSRASGTLANPRPAPRPHRSQGVHRRLRPSRGVRRCSRPSRGVRWSPRLSRGARRRLCSNRGVRRRPHPSQGVRRLLSSSGNARQRPKLHPEAIPAPRPAEIAVLLPTTWASACLILLPATWASVRSVLLPTT